MNLGNHYGQHLSSLEFRLPIAFELEKKHVATAVTTTLSIEFLTIDEDFASLDAY